MSLETVFSVMREGKWYSVEDLSKQLGISKSYTGTCLRSLWRGQVVDRKPVVVGETKNGKPVTRLHYLSKQKDLAL